MEVASVPLAARLRTPRILWGAMLASVGMYAGLIVSGALESGPVKQSHDGGGPLPLPILFGLPVALAVASFVVPRVLHRQAIARAQFEIEERPMNVAPTNYRSASGRYRQFTPAVYAAALPLFFVPFILSLALSESIALLGVVGAATGVPQLYCLPLFGVSALLIAIRFPTWSGVVAPIEKQHDAVAPPFPDADRSA